jgi:hypothetical protein
MYKNKMDNCKKRTIIQDDDTSDAKEPKVSTLRELPYKPIFTYSYYCHKDEMLVPDYTNTDLPSERGSPISPWSILPGIVSPVPECLTLYPLKTSFTLPDDITCDMINIIFQRLLNLYTTNTHLYVFDIIKVNHEKFTIKANATILYGDLPISCGFKVYLFKIPNKDNILIDIMPLPIMSFYDCTALNHVYNYTCSHFSIN